MEVEIDVDLESDESGDGFGVLEGFVGRGMMYGWTESRKAPRA